RARNVRNVLAALDALRSRVETAAKSGALPVILSGDCSVALAVVAGLHRYSRNVSLLYADADADLQTPATTPSGCVDGMVVSHLVGRGASEMVRFYSEPPLVREPDLALFGVSRLDPAEEQALQTSPLRRYLADDIRRKSPGKAATEAVDRIHGNKHDFVLHFDVDVIAGFQATNLPSSEGLNIEALREAFSIFASQPHLAAIEITGYNPSKDSDASCANLLVDFLGDILSIRQEKMKAAAPEAPAPASETMAKPADASDENLAVPATTTGEAWSSDTLDQRKDAEPLEQPAEPLDKSEEPRL
ncbi:MAG: arginase family protein, partial [Candidatus Acidiferrales bacterium]